MEVLMSLGILFAIIMSICKCSEEVQKTMKSIGEILKFNPKILIVAIAIITTIILLMMQVSSLIFIVILVILGILFNLSDHFM